jgi:hypothetical protein
VVGSYIHEGQFKTDASFRVIYDILLSWKLKMVGPDKMLQNVK